MKHSLNHFLLGGGVLASLLLLSSSLTSCQDEDYGYTAEQIAYQTNFEKTFGKIAPDQIWDFSSYNLERLGLSGGPTAEDKINVDENGTRAMSEDPSIIRTNITTGSASGYYTVTQKTINWLNQNLPEKVDSRSLSKPFKLLNPYYTTQSTDDNKGKFLIIPIYQGQSGMLWDLHLVDDTKDYNIWSKSDHVRYTVDYSQWEEFMYNSYIEDKNADGWAEASPAYFNTTDIRLKNPFSNLSNRITTNTGDVTYDTNMNSIKVRFELPTKDEHGKEISSSATGAFYLVNRNDPDNIKYYKLSFASSNNGNYTFSTTG